MKTIKKKTIIIYIIFFVIFLIILGCIIYLKPRESFLVFTKIIDSPLETMVPYKIFRIDCSKIIKEFENIYGDNFSAINIGLTYNNDKQIFEYFGRVTNFNDKRETPIVVSGLFYGNFGDINNIDEPKKILFPENIYKSKIFGEEDPRPIYLDGKLYTFQTCFDIDGKTNVRIRTWNEGNPLRMIDVINKENIGIKNLFPIIPKIIDNKILVVYNGNPFQLATISLDTGNINFLKIRKDLGYLRNYRAFRYICSHEPTNSFIGMAHHRQFSFYSFVLLNYRIVNGEFELLKMTKKLFFALDCRKFVYPHSCIKYKDSFIFSCNIDDDYNIFIQIPSENILKFFD